MRWLIAVLVVSSVSLPVHADPAFFDARPATLAPRPDNVMFVPILETGPTVDGNLDDPQWQQAAVSRAWRSYPGGAADGVDAEVRVVADRDNLYVAYTLHGDEHLILKEPQTGVDEYGGSLFEVFLDPNRKGRTRVQHAANPAGLRYDKYDYRRDWQGSWKSVGKVDGNTWRMEMSFPANELNNRYMGHQQYWRANFCIVYHDADGEHHVSWTGDWDDQANGYGVLFFGDREQYVKTIRPWVWMYLDRATYDVRDAAGVALIRTFGAADMLDELAVKLTVRQGDEVMAEQTVDRMEAQSLDVTFDVASLAEGDYEMTVEVLRDGQAIAGEAQAFTKKRRSTVIFPEGEPSGSIPVHVWKQPDLEGEYWPVTTGVPFASGVLDDPVNVRLLDPNGREVPVQTFVRNRWSPRGSVRWLGLDFIPTLSAEKQTYTLEYGPTVRSGATSMLSIKDTDDQITVNTGPLRFTVDRKAFNFIDQAWLNGKLIVEGDAGLTLVDHEGSRYRAALDRDVEVVVEEAGPVRATIRATGWYVREGSDGSRTSSTLPTDRLCKFTVRLSAFAGSPLLKAAVSTTITYDSDHVRLRDLSIGLPVRADGAQVGDIAWTGDGHVTQHHWDKCVDHTGAEHPRAEGWIAAGPVTLAVRKFWQLFPAELGFNDGVLSFHAWPAHGREPFEMNQQLDIANIYKVWFAHQGEQLDFNMPEPYYDKLKAHLEANPNISPYYEAMRYSNAQGLTIHNDLLIAFDGRAGETVDRLVDVDPHALPDPAYLCATGAIGPILHGDAAFAELDATYLRGYLSLQNRTADNPAYGKFVHGNMPTYWRYAGDGMADIHRVWMNGHYHVARMPFVQYARTGDARWMDWGRDHANTLRDVGTCNYVSDDARFRYHLLGAVYHCKGFAPWAGDAHVTAHPTCIDYLAYDWWIYGNRRSLDVLHNWVEGIKVVSPGGNDTREGMTTFADLVTAYEATHDAALVEYLHNYANKVYAKPLADQGNWDYHTQLLFRDWQLRGDERTISAYRDAVAQSAGTTPGGNMHYDGYFALLDANADRLRNWQERLYAIQTSWVDNPDDIAHGHTHHMWRPLAYEAHKYPFLLKALKRNNLQPQRPAVTPDAGLFKTRAGRSYVAVREQSDGAFDVTLRTFRPWRRGATVRVLDASGKVVAEASKQPAEAHQETDPLVATVPADGRAGEYLIIVETQDFYDFHRAQLTDLPGEVQLLTFGDEWENQAGAAGARYYTAVDTDTLVNVYSHAKTALGMELIDASGNVLNRLSTSRYVRGKESSAALTPDVASIYVSDMVRLKPLRPSGAVIVAMRPESLFTPTVEPPAQ